MLVAMLPAYLPKLEAHQRVGFSPQVQALKKQDSGSRAKKALEAAGLEFNDQNGGGGGVRFGEPQKHRWRIQASPEIGFGRTKPNL